MAVSMSSLRLKLFIRSCTFEKPGRFYLKATAFGDEKRTSRLLRQSTEMRTWRLLRQSRKCSKGAKLSCKLVNN